MLQGDPYDKRADVFSFGVMLWELAKEETPDLVKQVRGKTKGSYLLQLAELLNEGHRLQLQSAVGTEPENGCFPAFYCDIVQACMKQACKDRPTFAQLMDQFQEVNSL